MTTTVVTGFGPAGYDLYGKNFLKTFDLYWPKNVNVYYYVESPVDSPRGTCLSLWLCDGAHEFFERNKDIAEYCGRAEVKGWREKDRKNGYSFRWDAVKWFRQIVIPNHAAGLMNDGDILAWFDADVVTFKDVPDQFIDKLVGHLWDLVYIGRDKGEPELGFWAVRLNPVTRAFLKAMADCYTSDEVFKLEQYHSGFVFDNKMKVYENLLGMKIKSLAPPMNGHIWHCTPLGDYSDHLKGPKRKVIGYSAERKQ